MEMLERIYGFAGRMDEYGVHGDGTTKIEELYRVRGMGDLYVEKGEVTMAQAIKVEMGETV